MQTIEGKSVVYTLTARCRDCYRCIRKCPVKAIAVKDGQAYIDDERCICCGTCTRECPQGAKTYRQDYIRVKEEIEAGKRVIATIAPSFAGAYNARQSACIPSVLRILGFSAVFETAEGALHVAAATAKHIEGKDGCQFCTACPTVVNYVEKYCPEKIDNLVPVVSPMIAHGKLLREKFGEEAIIVFIGPCIAKKYEAEREEYKGIIDYAITFEELDRWTSMEEIDYKNCEESPFDAVDASGKARRFPLPGGLFKTAEKAMSRSNGEFLSTTGRSSMFGIFELEDKEDELLVIDHLFCSEGCINGPGISKEKSLFERRRNLVSYAKHFEAEPIDDFQPYGKLSTQFVNREIIDEKKITENEINDVLELTGKRDQEAQLNCGACGYGSCIDMAKAVIKGLAEPDMCMPYMRRMAEQRSDKIIETSPNGIVLVDEELKIISMNPAFKKLFMCTDSIAGRRISYLFDAAGYEKLTINPHESVESVVEYGGKVYHQLLYALEGEKQLVGIYIDITKLRMDEEKINVIRLRGLEQANNLLDHQIRMAQDMAKFLGENTARGEELVRRLLSTYENRND